MGRKPHRYVLLACSDGDSIESQQGLSTSDCLDFLLALGTRDARVCGYYLGYDWTMILRDLDNQTLYHLFRPELRLKPNGAFARVDYKGFQLHWLAGAMWLRDDHRKVTVWDLGKYYQGPFVNALKDWKIRPDVVANIARMKQRRSLFTWREIKSIRDYCMQECEALAEFAFEVERAHLDADLKPRSWYGPGSTASVLLNRFEIRDKRGVIPPMLLEPIARAFFGGRAELSRNGFVRGPIWGYDISSAYPYHASLLPCLEHGTWERVSRERSIKAKNVAHALVYGHIVDCKGAWGPLPIRLADGTIVFPRSGASGYWWRDEWLAAREGWGDGVEFDHAYVLRKRCNCKPFAFMPQIFARRQQVDKESGEGKILKLAMNSVYGKLAQQIGSAQFASRAWAGMITSGTRAQVLRLMLRHKRLDSILMIATDGLFSTERLDVNDQITLGGWERKEHDSITLVRPGIYWLGGAEIFPFPDRKVMRNYAYVRVGDGGGMMVPIDQIGGTKVRARGLGRENLANAKVTLAIALKTGVDVVTLDRRTQFGGAKQHVRVSPDGIFERSPNYGQWHLMPTHVTLKAGPKREANWAPPTLSDVESHAFGVRSAAMPRGVFDFLEQLRDYLN